MLRSECTLPWDPTCWKVPCLAYELRKEGLQVLTQVPLPLVYHEVRLDVGYRLDLLVEDLVGS